MSTIERQNEIFDKIIKGMDKVYDNLIAFKKQKKSELVVMQGGKIVRIKP